MIYAPNWSNPRVLKTAKKALSFVALYTSNSQKVWISRNELYRHFGNTSRPLGRYLKEHLLIEADSYYNAQTGTCKKYTKNALGFSQIKQLAGLTNFTPELSAEQEQQLASGDFDYSNKSNRSFNSLQYIPKAISGSLMANHGYVYYYDIEAAAPTLIMQRAKKLNPELDLSNLEYYTQNRSQLRQQIAQDCMISESQVKTVINGLLTGGVISCWQGGKIFKELNYSVNSVINLNHNPLVIGIKQDIKQLWQTLKQEFPVRYLEDKNGKSRRRRLSARDKSSLYFELESEVGDVIRRSLRKNKIKALWKHDGWCCDKFIDPIDVEREVKRLTGYSIKLDWNKYEDK